MKDQEGLLFKIIQTLGKTGLYVDPNTKNINFSGPVLDITAHILSKNDLLNFEENFINSSYAVLRVYIDYSKLAQDKILSGEELLELNRFSEFKNLYFNKKHIKTYISSPNFKLTKIINNVFDYMQYNRHDPDEIEVKELIIKYATLDDLNTWISKLTNHSYTPTECLEVVKKFPILKGKLTYEQIYSLEKIALKLVEENFIKIEDLFYSTRLEFDIIAEHIKIFEALPLKKVIIKKPGWGYSEYILEEENREKIDKFLATLNKFKEISGKNLDEGQLMSLTLEQLGCSKLVVVK